MAGPNSTVIALVGSFEVDVFPELDRSSNVRASAIERDAGGTARVLVARSHALYVVHDEDPLAELGAAWVAFFDESAPAGRLEVAMEDTVGAFLRGDAALPDYYLVLAPDALPVTVRNWWFGALAGVAPSRVVPSGPSAAEVQSAIDRLPTGRWWPEPVIPWIRSLARTVPDDRTLLRPGSDVGAGPGDSR